MPLRTNRSQHLTIQLSRSSAGSAEDRVLGIGQDPYHGRGGPQGSKSQNKLEWSQADLPCSKSLDTRYQTSSCFEGRIDDRYHLCLVIELRLDSMRNATWKAVKRAIITLEAMYEHQ